MITYDLKGREVEILDNALDYFSSLKAINGLFVLFYERPLTLFLPLSRAQNSEKGALDTELLCGKKWEARLLFAYEDPVMLDLNQV